MQPRIARSFLVAILFFAVSGCTSRPDPSKLNVLIVTLDTTRADRIGAFGGTAVRTPNLDATAAEGTRFLQTMSTNPLTLPAHSSLFTGLYPFRHGVRHNGAYRLSESMTTLAERLHDAGFKTGAFVAAFVLDPSFGLNQGFDTYSGVASDTADANFLRPSALQRPASEVNEAFFRWLDGVGNDRFFAWVHYYDAHYPYAPPEAAGVALEGTGYDREISYVDHEFGALIAHLQQRDVLARTILVVVGDHGESLGSHGERTHGLFLYEPCLHVPLFVRAPGFVPAGAAYNSPTSLVDIAPSVLSLLALPQMEPHDGRVLFPRAGKVAPEDRSRIVYAETWMPRVEMGWSDLAMLRGDRFKLIRAPHAELYDLTKDSGESTNLYDVDHDVSGDMSDALQALLDTSPAPKSGNMLTAEELAKLQSLGYLRGGVASATNASGRLDPKDHVQEVMHLEAAEEAMERGDLQAALDGFSSVLSENATNHAALLGRVRVLLLRGDLGKAREAAEAALAAAGSDPDAPPPVGDNARGLLATISALSGRWEEGQAYLRTASHSETTGPKRSPVAVLLAAAKNRDEAQAIVGLATRLRPADPWSWAAKAHYARKVGDGAAVVDAVQHLEDLGTNSVQALIDLGQSAQDAGETKLALAIFTSAYRIEPNHPDVLGYLGTALLAAGDLEGARQAFEGVSRVRPDDPRAPMYLANIALLQGDETKARRLIDDSLRRSPNFIPPLLNYARWLHEKGRTPEAIKTTESALQRRPGDAGAEALLTQLRAAMPSANGRP
jgi:choline-sulfatase